MIWPCCPSTGYPNPLSNHESSDPSDQSLDFQPPVQPPEIWPPGPTIGDLTSRSNHRYGHRWTALDERFTGEPLSTVWLLGVPLLTVYDLRGTSFYSRGAALYGMATRQSLCTAWLPKSRSWRYGHRVSTLCGKATREPPFIAWPPRSRTWPPRSRKHAGDVCTFKDIIVFGVCSCLVMPSIHWGIWDGSCWGVFPASHMLSTVH